MNGELIARYQSGGDLYKDYAARFGTSAADAIAAAAQSGDETQVNAAITQAQYGAPLDTSTLSILASQSPSDWVNNADNYWTAQANSVGKNFLQNLFGNSAFWILAVVGVVALFFYAGGLALVKGRFKK